MAKCSRVTNGAVFHYAASVMALSASLSGSPAAAQSAGPSQAAATPENDAPLEEILVTARRRSETALSTPVAITAVGGAELERRQITGVDNLSQIVPQLVIGEGGGSYQGGLIALRGIGSGESNALIDQSVSFNVDGVAIAKATVRRLSELDLAQVEVLRGPQALFFGKNSPGGIISLRSADPTRNLEAQVSIGYEFNARDKQVTGYVSGPLTENLGARFAFFADSMDGWVTDETPRSNPLAPAYTRLPRSREWAGRLTLTYNSGSNFDARAKLSISDLNGAGPAANMQLIACPVGGRPQGASTGDCIANDKQTHIDNGTAFLTSANPAVAANGQRIGGSVPFLTLRQALASLEMNYSPADNLKLTSVTGYYDVKQNFVENFEYNDDPNRTVPAGVRFYDSEFSQELRLATDFKGPVNFMIGGLYSHMDTEIEFSTLFGSVTPSFLQYANFRQRDDAWSVFAQARWNIVPTLELSGGGRYSQETKEIVKAAAGATFASGVPPIPKQTWTNFSPEATLTWRPTERLTAYASYKEGFLSGGYNGGATSVAALLPYDQQLIKGGEVGLKALVADRRLRLNLTYYNYDVTGLAITTSQNAVVTVLNAGKVGLQGIEFDANYAVPSIEGLTLRGSVAWERARYQVYSAACWTGQTPSQGCNQGLNAAGTAFTVQDLAGTQLLRAPDWTATGGVVYERQISDPLKIVLSADGNYSSSYVTDGQSIPFARQPAFAKLDLSASLSNARQGWSAAIIARNVTDQYTFVRSAINPFSGANTGTPAGIPPDVAASISRGREIWLRLTFSFGR